MNIDTKFFGAIIFLLAQAIAAVIWGASLSAEVSRLSVLQDKANETASIDVIAFRLDDLTKEIEDMKELDRESSSSMRSYFLSWVIKHDQAALVLMAITNERRH